MLKRGVSEQIGSGTDSNWPRPPGKETTQLSKGRIASVTKVILIEHQGLRYEAGSDNGTALMGVAVQQQCSRH